MLSSFAWLALLQPTLSIMIGLVFLVSALLSLSLLKPRRKAGPLLQAIGLIILAVPYTLTFTGIFTPTVASPIVFIASLFIIAGFIISRLRITSAVAAKPDEVIKAKVASALQTISSPLPTESAAKPKPTLTPPSNPVLPPQTTPSPVSRTAISAKSGLRSEPLVKLPALKRKRARQFVNFLIGFFVFFLIGWGSYVIAKRVIQPPTSLDTSSFNNTEPSSSPLPPAVDSPAASPVTETPTGEPSASHVPTDQGTRESVTIKDTETGYLNVREGASTATKLITTIDPGSTYPLLDTSTNGDWYKIELDDGEAGWISTKYAEKNPTE